MVLPPPPSRLTPPGALRRAASAVAPALLVGLGACGAPVLTPAGPVAAGERQILFDSLLLMLTIVVPTIAATFAFAWWFRAGNTRARRRPDWAFSGRIEVVVWAVPLLTIMFLGGMTWVAAHRLDPAAPLPSREKPLEVQVVSLDWKWLFILPEQGVASVNTLTVPTGRPLHLSLTSGSVMNVFFVPQLGSMIYTMNGMADQLWLQADRPGDYMGLAAMISGDGFPDMHFDVRAATPAAFAGWVAAARGAGGALDRPGYAALSRQSVVAKPFTFGAVAPGLFQQIVSQAVPPGPGPAAKAQPAPGPSVFPKPLRAP